MQQCRRVTEERKTAFIRSEAERTLSAWSRYFKESFICKHTVNGRLFNLPRAYSLRLSVAIKAYVRVCLASACFARVFVLMWTQLNAYDSVRCAVYTNQGEAATLHLGLPLPQVYSWLKNFLVCAGKGMNDGVL